MARNTILTAFFVFLSIFALHASAQPVYDIDPSCGDVILQPTGISVGVGDTAAQAFSIANHSNLDFLLDHVSVSSQDPEVSLYVMDYDRVVPRGGDASVRIGATAMRYPENARTGGVFRVRGHYNQGTDCFSSDIGEERFTVFVSGQPTIALAAPPAYSTTSYYTSQPVYQYKHPAVYTQPYYTRPLQSVYTQPTQPYYYAAPVYQPLTEPVYLHTATIRVPTTVTTYYPAQVQPRPIQPPKQEPPMVSRTQLSLEIEAEATEDGASILVTVSNTSSQEVEGMLSVGVPEGWSTEGERTVTVPSNTQKVLLFTAKSGTEALDGLAEIRFTAGELALSKNIALSVPAPEEPEPEPEEPAPEEPPAEPEEPGPLTPPATGFFGLGAGAIVIGILILAVIVAAVFVE